MLTRQALHHAQCAISLLWCVPCQHGARPRGRGGWRGWSRATNARVRIHPAMHAEFAQKSSTDTHGGGRPVCMLGASDVEVALAFTGAAFEPRKLAAAAPVPVATHGGGAEEEHHRPRGLQIEDLIEDDGFPHGDEARPPDAVVHAAHADCELWVQLHGTPGVAVTERRGCA